MKKLIVTSMVILAGLQMVFAQNKSDIKDEIREQRDALIKEHRMESIINSKAAGLAGPTAADVGEPDSFGKNVKFMGIAQAGIILLDSTCAPADIGPLGPDDRCIVVSPSAPLPTTTFNDIGRITIPGKSLDNILYAIANHTVNANFQNTTGVTTQGRLGYVPSVTIVSEALNDPSLIDPTTGLPFNGSFTTGGLGTLTETRTVATGFLEVMTHSYTRANTLGFSRTFFAALGLSDQVIDKIYKKPITVKLNVRVSGKLIESGVITYSIRFLGN